MNKISQQEAKPLLDALYNSYNRLVRLTALQLLVRLDLTDEVWLEVGDYVMSLLQTTPEGESLDSRTLNGIPYHEVIEAAAFVSTEAVKTHLNELLEAADKDVRTVTENALAKAENPESVSKFFEELSNPNPEQYYLNVWKAEILIYLPPKFASRLVTSLVQDAVEYALTVIDAPPGNEILRAVAALQNKFEPDILGLFECYIVICESASVLDVYGMQWSVSWEIAWIVSRATPERVRSELRPFLDSDERVRDLAIQLIEDSDICREIDETPQFGGALDIFVQTSRPLLSKWLEPGKDKKRYANYEFHHLGKVDSSSRLERNEALRIEHWYELRVWISHGMVGMPIEDQWGKLRPIELDNTEPVTIYVLFEPDPTYFEFNENERVQTLRLEPKGGGSTKSTLLIRPKAKTLSEKVLAEVSVRIYYHFNEIESMKIVAEVVGNDEELYQSRFGLKKTINATYRKLGDWKSLDEIQSREMHIAIKSLGNDRYELTFLYEDVKFKGALRLTKEEVEDSILQARNLLGYLAVDPESPINLGQPLRLREIVYKLVEVGRLLWSKVFHSERNKSLWHIGQFLKEHPLKRDGIIQIVVEDNAAGFVFPWNLLYDGTLDIKASMEAILDGFWGMRYCLEQIYGSIRNSWSGRPVQVDEELQLSFMVLQELPNADLQRQFIAGLRERSHQRINVGEVITDATNCYNLLKNCNSHILYFYTRGYTRRRQADLTVKPDLKRGEHGAPEPEKSYIELSGGKLYLVKLEADKQLINLCQKPVVFLNMCESAQITPFLSEGFIQFFLDQQASAVIGTECPMTTRFAHPFAMAFFDALLSGEPLGTALLKARRKFLNSNELFAPLSLAYTLYGLATVHYQPPPLSNEVYAAHIGAKN